MKCLNELLECPLHLVELEQKGFVKTNNVYAGLPIFKREGQVYLFTPVNIGSTCFYKLHPAFKKNIEVLE